MDAIEGLFELIAFLFRAIIFLFELMDVLEVLYGMISSVVDLMSRGLASIPWFRRKPVPKVEMQALADRYRRKRHLSAASK